MDKKLKCDHCGKLRGDKMFWMGDDSTICKCPDPEKDRTWTYEKH